MALPTALDKNIVQESLRLTDTEDFSSRKMNMLSGGELQRVFLAGAVAQRTPILLLDEPTTFLDPFHRQLIIKALERIQRDFKTTILAVTHEISSIIGRYSNVLGLKKGKSYSPENSTQILIKLPQFIIEYLMLNLKLHSQKRSKNNFAKNINLNHEQL